MNRRRARRAATAERRCGLMMGIYIEQLNVRGVFGPSAAEDERLIRVQPEGDVVWNDLVERDAKRRLELAEPIT